MPDTTQAQSAATAFASINGYDLITYKTEFKKYLVFQASTATLEGAIYGYPLYVLVDKDLHCRYACIDECLQIISKVSKQEKREYRQ